MMRVKRTCVTGFVGRVISFVLGVIVIAGCSGEQVSGATSPHGVIPADEVPVGPHGGRLLGSDEFELELALIETSDPPVFRAWATRSGVPVAPNDLELHVRLGRLGGRVDDIGFSAAEGFLQGDQGVGEPHSFDVIAEVVHAGATHRFTFAQTEGRTRIDAAMARQLGIETEVAGPASIVDSVRVYGRIGSHPDGVRKIRARFDGVVDRVQADLGARVAAGDELLRIESNESLNVYPVRAPIGGIVTMRDVNPGEQTAGRLLLEVTDPSRVVVDLAVFPSDRSKVRVGSPVSVVVDGTDLAVEGEISMVEVIARSDQSVIARVEFENPDGALVPGTFVTAEVVANEYEAPLAVRSSALQRYRDGAVVYAQIGDEYEVRMIDVGRRDRDWVEVLSGLEPGTRYVVANSHLVKADIEKSGAAHDH